MYLYLLETISSRLATSYVACRAPIDADQLIAAAIDDHDDDDDDNDDGDDGDATGAPRAGSQAAGSSSGEGAHRVWSRLAAVVVERTRSGAGGRVPESQPASAWSAERTLLTSMLPVFEAELLERLRPLAAFAQSERGVAAPL